jgi:hypothetical protein
VVRSCTHPAIRNIEPARLESAVDCVSEQNAPALQVGFLSQAEIENMLQAFSLNFSLDGIKVPLSRIAQVLERFESPLRGPRSARLRG